MQKLRHPNVVRLFDVIETPKHTVLVLEFLTGGMHDLRPCMPVTSLAPGELFDYLVSRTKLSEREAQKFIRQARVGHSFA